jgi:N-methylhydantoinase A
MTLRLGIDVGGTFTDAIAVGDHGVVAAKVLSTPGNQAAGVKEAIREVLEAIDRGAKDVRTVTHGTTVATNALLDRKGARTALIATEGFSDLLVLGRQARPHLYDLTRHPTPPVIPTELSFEVNERQSSNGVLRPLDRRSLRKVIADIDSADVESVAICLLFSFADPVHEELVAAAVSDSLPDAFVVTSHEIAPEFREYERAVTTAVDAYLGPITRRYLGRLDSDREELGLPEPEIMQSNGGVCSVADASRHAARLILSGPVGGVAGAGALAQLLDIGDVVTLDMGGTSTDVGVIRDGKIGRSPGLSIDGLPIRLPSIDVHTVGAGGGSIAWIDSGGALRVGPISAGARPGPACYGRGGTEPTVTDANLILGYLSEAQPLGDLRLDWKAAFRALTELEAGFDSVEALAEGIVAVANAEMARAIRVVTVEKGLDPGEFHLLAFGGAGPLHASALAEELQLAGVIVPATPGVLSALGLTLGERRFEIAQSMIRPLQSLLEPELQDAFDDLRARSLKDWSTVETYCDLRYRGQSFELEIPYSGREPLAALETRFHHEHELAYGYSSPSSAVELVALRVAMRQPRESVDLNKTGTWFSDLGRREIRWHGEKVEAPVVSGIGFGELDGPAVIDLSNSTCIVPPDWVARQVGSLALTLEPKP